MKSPWALLTSHFFALDWATIRAEMNTHSWQLAVCSPHFDFGFQTSVDDESRSLSLRLPTVILIRTPRWVMSGSVMAAVQTEVSICFEAIWEGCTTLSFLACITTKAGSDFVTFSTFSLSCRWTEIKLLPCLMYFFYQQQNIFVAPV